jgi:hypothetical protein
MTTTFHTTFTVLGVILLITSMILFQVAMQFAQTHLASAGWHELASVNWNG